MFLASHILGSSLLALEGKSSFLIYVGVLAYLAFSGLPNDCHDGKGYPCKIASLYNENFVNIPFIG